MTLLQRAFEESQGLAWAAAMRGVSLKDIRQIEGGYAGGESVRQVW